MIRVSIVAPCYNEEAGLRRSAERLVGLLRRMAEEHLVASDSFILLVNDGSADGTWREIRAFHHDFPSVRGLDLAHNVGQQAALMAGLMEVAKICDAAVTVDIDLQDDINRIPEMVRLYEEGCEVVYGVRSSRGVDPVMKRLTAAAFYRLQRAMGIEAVANHADFRLMGHRVLEELARYGERNLYLRGIVPLMGFRAAKVEYPRVPREGGKSKYTFRRMASLALDGLTSFSVKPLKIVIALGCLFVLFALAMGIYVLVSILMGKTVAGWSSLILSIWFVGGMIMMAVGMTGLYIGRIYIEVKGRPRYHVRERIF